MYVDTVRTLGSARALARLAKRARIDRSRRYSGLMTKREQREAATILERLAATVARGEVAAPAGFVGRIEGAAAALRLLGGPRPHPNRKR